MSLWSAGAQVSLCGSNAQDVWSQATVVWLRFTLPQQIAEGHYKPSASS